MLTSPGWRRVLVAAGVCTVLDGVLGLIIANRSGLSEPVLLAVNALFGAVLGLVSAVVVGALIRRIRGLAYVPIAGLWIALLVMAALLAAAESVVIAATLGIVVPLYGLAAIITCLMVRPGPKAKKLSPGTGSAHKHHPSS